MSGGMDAPGFDVGAAVQVWADMRDGIRSLNRRWKATPEVIATAWPKQATSADTGNLLIPIGEPAQGRRWYVREIVVGGTLFSSAPAGTAVLCVSAAAIDPAAIPLYTVRDFTLAANALPQNAFYGRGEIVITHPEKLYLVIVGPTATTQYVATAWIEDLELGQDLNRQAP